MGRNAQPAAVKEAKGNPGRRPIAKEGAAAPASAIAAPKRMPARQKALWDRIAPELAAMRILRTSDLPAFRRYIVLLDKWQVAEEHLKHASLVIVTESEHVTMERIGKWMMVALHLDKRLSEIEDRFGMNPAARQRLMLQMAATQPNLPLDRPAMKAEETPSVPAVEAIAIPEGPVGLLN